jgi:hypothetical protein
VLAVAEHLDTVNLPADRVDWDRTERYAASARSGRYLETQAENDYTTLSNQITESLNEVAGTDDTVRRLAIVEDARKTLAEWPASHYNYREADIRQLLTMLDVAIADIRARSGQLRFDLNLVAFATPPPPTEPLLPAPPREKRSNSADGRPVVGVVDRSRVCCVPDAELGKNRDGGDRVTGRMDSGHLVAAEQAIEPSCGSIAPINRYRNACSAGRPARPRRQRARRRATGGARAIAG